MGVVTSAQTSTTVVGRLALNTHVPGPCTGTLSELSPEVSTPLSAPVGGVWTATVVVVGAEYLGTVVTTTCLGKVVVGIVVGNCVVVELVVSMPLG